MKMIAIQTNTSGIRTNKQTNTLTNKYEWNMKKQANNYKHDTDKQIRTPYEQTSKYEHLTNANTNTIRTNMKVITI